MSAAIRVCYEQLFTLPTAACDSLV